MANSRYKNVSNTSISMMSAMHILSSGETVTVMFCHVSPLPMPSNMIRLWNMYPKAVLGSTVDPSISQLVIEEYLGWKIINGAYVPNHNTPPTVAAVLAKRKKTENPNTLETRLSGLIDEWRTDEKFLYKKVRITNPRKTNSSH